jgi:2-amino-4-hydroxy-6-hydroxymethyldihydropteridine diphosphokinase
MEISYLRSMNKNGIAVWFSLGTNLGDRLGQLQATINRLQNHNAIHLQGVSPVYETAAWGKTDQPDFLNCVLKGETHLSPEELLDAILIVEQELGRERRERWGMRNIDIDILFLGQLIYTSDRLIIPHPELHLRRFVLSPLTDLDPDLVHPVEQKTVRALLENCPDKGNIQKIEFEPAISPNNVYTL